MLTYLVSTSQPINAGLGPSVIPLSTTASDVFKVRQSCSALHVPNLWILKMSMPSTTSVLQSKQNCSSAIVFG